MPDEALQAAFEIKAACDDISRKLLRWHWEEKPGAHSVDALLKHLAQRQKESPDYYERLPELNGRTWARTIYIIRCTLPPFACQMVSTSINIIIITYTRIDSLSSTSFNIIYGFS